MSAPPPVSAAPPEWNTPPDPPTLDWLAPAWLRQVTSHVPGRLPLDEVITATVRAYLTKWRRLLPRALAVYLPGGLLVLLIHLLLGEVLALLVGDVVLFAGVAFLQAAEVTDTAGERMGREPAAFLTTLRALRPRSVSLLRAFGLLALRFLAPSIVFAIVAILVLSATADCGVTQGGDYLCTPKLALYWLLLIAFYLGASALFVRWSMLVPAVVLEGRSARDGIRRSVELTRGSRLRIGSWLVVVLLASLVVFLITHAVFSAIVPNAAVSDFLSDAGSDTVIGPLFVIMLTEMYFRLATLPQYSGGTPLPPAPLSAHGLSSGPR